MYGFFGLADARPVTADGLGTPAPFCIRCEARPHGRASRDFEPECPPVSAAWPDGAGRDEFA